jgi:Ran GTPase-activating protein (RanGAP) involved in mRNA processing and transport
MRSPLSRRTSARRTSARRTSARRTSARRTSARRTSARRTSARRRHQHYRSTSTSQTLNLTADSWAARHIAERLKVNTSLTSVNIRNCKLDSKVATELAASVAVNASLTSLNLSSNIIGGYWDSSSHTVVSTPEGAAAIAEALKVNTSLTSLNLMMNNLGPEGAKALAAGVAVSSSLTALNLEDNRICGLRKELDRYPWATRHDIQGVYQEWGTYTANGIKAIAEALKTNTSLTSLNLSKNSLAGETDFIKVTEVQGESFNVGDKVIYQGREMIISRPKDYYGAIKMRLIGGVKAIAEALKVKTSLTSLDLGFNNIGDDGAKVIAEALKVNTSLTSLILGSRNDANTALYAYTYGENFESNNIGVKGAIAIADMLCINRSLKSLHLTDNIIGAEGASAIAEALMVNTSLTELDLCMNQLSGTFYDKDHEQDFGTYRPDGIKAIAEALKVNTSLETLDISFNGIENDEGWALAEGVAVNASLVCPDKKNTFKKKWMSTTCAYCALQKEEHSVKGSLASIVMDQLHLSDKVLRDFKQNNIQVWTRERRASGAKPQLEASPAPMRIR